MQDSFTIGTFAKAAGVSVETIRYYQRKGLLSEPHRPHGKVRRYGPRDMASLNFVKTAKWLGFSLAEVAELLRLDEGGHCEEVRSLGEQKLEEVRQKLAELKRMEQTLDELVRACRNNKNSACPLIESLQDNRR